MTPTPSDTRLFTRYLRLLGVAPAPPDLRLLSALNAAHLHRVPFENISKLLYFRRDHLTTVAPLAQYLDGIEHHRFGGTCYPNASHFHSLLRHLGFDVRLCGADMANPDVHLVNMVTIDNREYLIDVGYGSPFWTPLPLDAPEDVVIEFGEDRYVLRPRDKNCHSRLDFYHRGLLHHGYTAKPTPRTIDFFRKPIADSFLPTSTFFNTTCVARFSPHESVTIRPDRMERVVDGVFSREPITSRAQLYDKIERHFGIARALVAEALDTIPLESNRT